MYNKVLLTINLLIALTLLTVGAAMARPSDQGVTVVIEADVNMRDGGLPQIGECELVGWIPKK